MSDTKKGDPKFKRPEPLSSRHDCTKMAVMVEKVTTKHGKPYIVYQCADCGQIWEEEL